ncbi:hypothetical protein BDB01DRAFT_851861 [Pilobolus umbonatus]|nr:hypothetical protein BDB01DRAFT_851861 [Pilobolus umbonatus]
MIQLKRLHLIQIVHIWNTLIGIILFALLVSVSNHIALFITEGAVLAGYGNFTTFGYPATYVYMLIPVISATIYSLILTFDYSANYQTWKPSKTLRTSIFLLTFALFLASIFPVINGGDLMAEGSSLDCHWADYMQWKVIYGNPDQFPWVTGMDNACHLFRVADGFCWVMTIGWVFVSYLYVKSSLLASKA